MRYEKKRASEMKANPTLVLSVLYNKMKASDVEKQKISFKAFVNFLNRE
jgi:hypothetical protein